MAHDDPNCYDAVIPWSRANNVHHEMQVGSDFSERGNGSLPHVFSERLCHLLYSMLISTRHLFRVR
jgi:hypothetical protein